MKIRQSSYFLITILIIMLIVIIYSSTFQSLETKLLPLIVSGVVFILAAIELRRELLKTTNNKLPGELEVKDMEETKGELQGYLVFYSWMVTLLLAIYLIGFTGAIFLFILCYLKFNGKRWIISGGIALAMVLFIYVLATFVLKVDLYRGLLLKKLILF